MEAMSETAPGAPTQRLATSVAQSPASGVAPGPSGARKVVVVGGGLSGGLFALRLSLARPDFRIVVIENRARLGRGVAYGACSPHHLLNVPVSRMEVGLRPSFADWLTRRAPDEPELIAALAESGGAIADAFAPRALFGAYLEERIAERLGAAQTGEEPGLIGVRGEAVRLLGAPRRGVTLSDGREFEADIVVLATGNLAPGRPGGAGAWLYDTAAFIPDPWSPDAFEDVRPDDPLLLLGTGLTMVDIVLRLAAAGHTGPMLAVSRRGLAPRSHRAGGAWPAFLADAPGRSPAEITGLIRAQAAAAEAAGVPWQRVFDAARPAVPAIWRGWSVAQKRQFLRHLRARWDVFRHRMAPRIGEALESLVVSGALEMRGARIAGYRPIRQDGRERVEASLALRGGGRRIFAAARVINCTGPRRDLASLGVPLVADLRERGLALPDALGLGLETENGALLDKVRRPSDWLYALGALTCPAWWEITAVPEIAVEVANLTAELAVVGAPRAAHHTLSAADFLDLGAGI